MENKLYLTPIGDTKELFNQESDILAIKDDGVFRVFKSEKSFDIMGYSAPITSIVNDKNETVHWIYPLTGVGDFQLINLKDLNPWRKVVKLVEKYEASRVPVMPFTEKKSGPLAEIANAVRLTESPFSLVPSAPSPEITDTCSHCGSTNVASMKNGDKWNRVCWDCEKTQE